MICLNFQSWFTLSHRSSSFWMTTIYEMGQIVIRTRGEDHSKLDLALLITRLLAFPVSGTVAVQQAAKFKQQQKLKKSRRDQNDKRRKATQAK